jgi:hypothetical protein
MDASKAPARTVTNFEADIDGEGNKTALDFVLQTNQHLQGLLAKEKKPRYHSQKQVCIRH